MLPHRVPSRPCWPSSLLLSLALATSLRADALITLEGSALEGSTRFDGESLVFTPRTGSALKLSLAEVFRLTIGTGPEPRLSSGLVLVEGSRIRVRDFIAYDGRTLRFRGDDGAERVVSLAGISEFVFTDRGPVSEPPLEPGAILANGDFFAGELVSIRDDQATISSVLFGLRRFRIGGEVQSVWLRPSRPLRTARVLTLADGSCLDGSSAFLRDGKLIVDDPVNGRFTLQPKDIRELRLGGDRLVPLTALKPSGGNAAELFPSHRVVSGSDAAGRLPRLEQRVGSQLSYDLPEGARTFVAEVAAMPGTLPLSGLRFVVLVEGRPVARSDPVTSLDEPRRLAAPIRGGRRLTLLVEIEPPLDLPLRGVWIDPVLVRD